MLLFVNIGNHSRVEHRMTPEEFKVFEMIKIRRRDNPIKDGQIAFELGLTIRQVADICKHLIEDYNIPIGAAKEYPMGRFIIDTREELDRYLTTLWATERSIRDRISALQRAFGSIQGKSDQLNVFV